VVKEHEMAKKTIFIVGAATFLFSVASLDFAGAVVVPGPEGPVCTDNTVPLQCNGQWDILSAASLGDEASLLRITVTDPLPVNPSPQNVAVRVCDVGILNDRYSAEVFRLVGPVNIQRCVTPVGGGCSVSPTALSPFATSDTLFFVIHVVQEDLNGTGIENARFQVTAQGWQTLRVQLLSNTPNVETLLPFGPGCP
jgi:hypothetical protein